MTEPLSTYDIPALPPPAQFETLPIYKILAEAKAGLAELKGLVKSIPNQGILIDTLSLQEAKASSEIENIVTTQDDLFRADPKMDEPLRGPVKEVAHYVEAIKHGWQSFQATQGLITNRALIQQYRILKSREDGFRISAGTVLRNYFGEDIYIPPQNSDDIIRHMTALERYINDDELCRLDPLIKMAIIHHQFESIHPFTDGNGRVGRMLNILYLCKTGHLDAPILYLSREINAQKSAYYGLLQAVRDAKNANDTELAWQNWAIFMLTAISETAKASIVLVDGIREQMALMKRTIRSGAHKKIYSQDLINNLFRHPYARVDYVMKDLKVSRPTASKYLELLSNSGLLKKITHGRNNYYINEALVALLMEQAVS